MNARYRLRKLLPTPALQLVLRFLNWRRYRDADHRAVFNKIYATNAWKDSESRSGDGSTLEVSARFREEFATWLSRHNIQTLVDVPCGDFNWMRLVHFPEGMTYNGLDVVPDLIESNKSRYAKPGTSFEVKDILEDDLPKADAYLCKDLFIHFPNKAIETAIANVRRSGSRFILITTFPGTPSNMDIPFGSARRTNMELILGPADELLVDFGGGVTDRFIGVWRLTSE